MTERHTLTSGASLSLLVDSSVLDSKITDTYKERVFNASASEDAEDETSPVETRVILVGDACSNQQLMKALEDIKMPCIKAESMEELGNLENTDFEAIFVLPDFKDPAFDYLNSPENRVLGPPIVMLCARRKEPLPFTSRPLYCASMIDMVLCFTGFRKKEELVRMVTLVHHMGGIIRKDFSSKVTHLIAFSTHGDKYRVAVSMGTPILKADWIYKAWERRDDLEFCAADEEFRNAFKVPPFQDCILSFFGFPDEERSNMEEMTVMQGGQHLPVGDERCTHLVVEEKNVKDLPFEPSKKLHVVKQEWFWGSIQMDARAGESMYLYEKSVSPALKKSVSLLSLNTPNSNRKKRRLRDTLAQLTRDTDISPFPPRKRQSAEHSLSMGSLLDISNTPESGKSPGDMPNSCSKLSKLTTPVPLKQSARWQVAMELYQTESNYIDILTTISKLFKEPLEMEGQLGGPILAPEEIKTIFGSIPDILEVHRRIKMDLEDLMINWSEKESVGAVFLNYSKDLVKAYPPFVNFFEMSKLTIVNCEKQKPRFHAFLKIAQSKPECGRQTLVELLIRPVQRLPSVVLLLTDVKKHTADDNPDKATLEKAIESLKEVMTHINEDKRKTEGQRQIFDVVYEVDGCPANLLSSHRLLVQRVETVSLSEELCDRGEQVTLFLFNDCLEIARKRHKVMNAFKSPHGHTRPPASLKHICLMPLSQIRKVLNITETEDCRHAFALVVRPPTEQENLLLGFQLTAEEPVKQEWLRILCRHIANTICKADSESLICTASPHSVDLNTKDMDSTLSRASRAIRKTSKKVTRVFSFTKTPKRTLQKALIVSSTPDETSPVRGGESFIGSLSSSSTLAINRSSSTFSLNGPPKHASVHRSNSLDGSSPSPRPRIILCTESPGSPFPSISKGRMSSSSPTVLSLSQVSSHSVAVPRISSAYEYAGDGQDSPSIISSRSSDLSRTETFL